MKIKEKIKSFLLSSTIFASVISVVGCEKTTEKNKPDQNYKYFVSKLSNIKINDKNQFIEKTNLKKLCDDDNIKSADFNFSVSNFNLDKIKLFGFKEKGFTSEVPINLTDLQNQKIIVDNKKISFKLDYGTFDLKNIIFISNFNLKISNKDEKSVKFNNITVFFQLSPNFSFSKRSDYNLDLYDFSNISNWIKYGIPDNEYYKEMTFTVDEKDENKPDIGYNPKVSKNSILTGDLIDDKKYYVLWEATTFSSYKEPLLFNMDLNKKIIFDGTNHEFMIECNKIVTKIVIEGNARDLKIYNKGMRLLAYFFSEFDVKNPEPASFKKGNFIIVFKYD